MRTLADLHLCPNIPLLEAGLGVTRKWGNIKVLTSAKWFIVVSEVDGVSGPTLRSQSLVSHAYKTG